MATEESIAVKTFGPPEKIGSGTVRITRWDPRERTMRALKLWALSWVLAVLTVAVPVAHFVLVPTFLILGPFLFYIFYKQESGVAGGEGECPFCQKQFTVVSGKEQWPIFEICNSCKNSVRLEKV